MLNPVNLAGGYEIGAYKGVNPLGGNSPHYFMCVGRDGAYSYWSPLSSNKKPTGIGSADGQGVIPKESRAGFTHFASGQTWYDTKQVWKIQNDFVIHAANTERSNRREGEIFNQIASSFIDSVFSGARELK
ncbi:hypothetical protein [Paraburkholderia sp. J10-1]|nr:hypothetical protein [Paraburkholderia sp. J10-1]